MSKEAEETVHHWIINDYDFDSIVVKDWFKLREELKDLRAKVAMQNSDKKSIPKCKTCKHADKSLRAANCFYNYTPGTDGCFALRKYL